MFFISDYHPENGIDKGFTELENDLSKLFFMKDKIKYNFDLQDNSKTVDMNLFFIVFSEDEKYTEFEVSTEELTKIDTVYDLYSYEALKPAFLPILCYAFALFFRIEYQQVRNYFKNKSKILWKKFAVIKKGCIFVSAIKQITILK